MSQTNPNSTSTESNEQTRLLIVGLGNPGAKYENTRHNVGFECLSRLHKQTGEARLTSKFEGQFVKTQLRSADVILIWPLTYMNASGRCVRQFANFFKVSADHILVVCDDLALPIQRLRFRRGGSSGGQNGLGNIIREMGTNDVPRLRIGIDPPPPRWDVANYVLSKFNDGDRTAIDQSIDRAADGCRDWVEYGIDHCMNHYNPEHPSNNSR